MKKIRICHFILGFHNGGVEKVLENYFSNMDLSKFELHIVTHMKPDLKRQKVFEEMGFQVHQFTRVHGHKIKIQNIKEYNKFFKQYKFDIVHNHFPENLLPLFFAKRYGVKNRILHSHNDYKTAFSKKSSVKKGLYNLGLKANVSNATHYFACGKKAGETVFGNKNAEKVTIIYNAIDTKLFRYNEKRREELREKLGIKDAFVLGHVGRYEPNRQKNQEFILEIYQEVLNEIPEARLLMIGEGERRKLVMEKANKMGILQNIIFTGAVQNASDYLQAMDVFVFPSLHEGLSVVSIEAQCAGLPLIASDTVSKETAITSLFSALPLDAPVKEWAAEVASKKQLIRSDHSTEIEKAGYEISVEAQKLQEMYEKMV